MTGTVAVMARLRLPASVALVAWTLLVWTTRLRNIWADESLSTGEQLRSTALAGSFTVLAVVLGVALWRRATWLRPAVLALAGWTAAVWVVRAVGIATADHSLGFVVVHLVLAIVSWVLAGLAAREVTAPATVRPAS